MDAALAAYGIYVVEDSRVLLPRLVELCSSITGALVVGYTGRADVAIAQIVERKPNAITLDIKLGIGTGFDVLLGMSRLDAAPTAVVLTNYTNRLYRTQAARLGAAYFFDKSCEIPKMVRVLRELIEKHQKKHRPQDMYGYIDRRSRDNDGRDSGPGL